jgi:hypothetical protein
MKRTILALSTALTLSMPAFAQSDAEMTVRDALDRYGYDQAAMETLTASEIALIYLSVTSEDSSSIRQTLASFDIQHSPMPAGMEDFARTSDVAMAVRDILERNGYDPAAEAMLTDAEVANLYLTATSESASDVSEVLDGFDLPQGPMVLVRADTLDSDSMNAFLMTRLESRGITMEQISSLTESEKAQLYLALSSDDESGIQDAITSVFAS